MAFTFTAVSADARELEAKVEAQLEGREAELVAFLKTKIEEIVKEVGGYVAISAGGHINPVSGRHGDKFWLTVSSLPKPDAPALSGQAPPEASVANPQQADGSTLPPAQGVPQPVNTSAAGAGTSS